MNISSNNILVTGGAGYIGSHIVEKLVKTHSNIIILDNLTTGFKKLINKKAIFIKGDIRNYNFLSKITKKYQISSIIHLAAYLNVSEAEKKKQKYYQNNILGTLNLVKCSFFFINLNKTIKGEKIKIKLINNLYIKIINLS